MFENQIQKKSVARKGNQRLAIFVLEVAAGDRVLGHVVGDLDRGLHPVRLLLHAAWRSRPSCRSSGALARKR